MRPDSGISLNSPEIHAASPSLLFQRSWQILLVLLGLFGSFFSFISSFQIPANSLLFSAVIVVMTAIFTLTIAVRKLLFILSPILAAAYLWAAVAFRELWIQGFLLVTNQMMRAFTANSSWEFTTYLVTAPVSSRNSCITIFLLFALFLIAWLLSWGIFFRNSFLLSFLLTFPFLAVPLFFTITPFFPAVLMLFSFWTGVFVSRYSSRRKKSSPKKNIRYSIRSQAGLVSLALLFLSFASSFLIFPFSQYRRPEHAESIRTYLEQSAVDLVSQIFLGGGLSEGDLDVGDNLSLSNRTMLRIRTDYTGTLYLKGYSGSYYTGRSWENLPFSFTTPMGDRAAFFPPSSISDAISLESPPPKLYFLDVNTGIVGNDFLYVPYGVVYDGSLASISSSDTEGYLRPNNSIREYSVNFYSWDSFYYSSAFSQNYFGDLPMKEYYLSAGSPALPPGPMREEEFRYRSAMYDQNTDLPPGVLSDLQVLCVMEGLNDFSGSSNPVEAAVEQVKRYLDETATYTLTPGDTPSDEDFVSYFLFENHQGYCVHFASAGTALLRAMGIPARYAEGYLVTQDDLASTGQDGYCDIRENRAHAWTEVYIPGFGWIPQEMTPGDSGIFGNSAQELPESSEQEPELEEPVSSQISDISNQSDIVSSSSILESSPLQNPTEPVAVWPFVVIGVILLLSTSWFVGNVLWKRHREILFSQPDRRAAVLALYRYLLKTMTHFAKIPFPPDISQAKDAAKRFGMEEEVFERFHQCAERAKFSRNGPNEEEYQLMKTEVLTFCDKIRSQHGIRRFFSRHK